MDITCHIENHIGQISYGWKEKSATELPQVVAIENEPWKGITTYSSLGQSSHVLRLPSDKNIRQEFMFGDAGSLSAEFVSSLILWMCESVIISHKAVSRGQTIRLPSEMVKSVPFDALYCTIPVAYKEALATFRKSDPATVFVWLIPISAVEAEFIDRNGWSAFETLLEENHSNLFDISRAAVIDPLDALEQ